MSGLQHLSVRRSLQNGGSGVRVQPRGFTLVELLVVIIIISILSAMTLGGLAGAAKSSRTQSTSLIIRVLNEAIMTQYEGYEDIALTKKTAADLLELRKRIRQEMPDAWADVADLTAGSASPARSGLTATYPAGVAYARYKEQRKAVSTPYQSAECLYMIITASGMFPDFLENVRPERVGDVDADGAKEFLDGWGKPIAFLRWAPGFSSPYSPIQFNDPSKYHDPIDDAGLDNTAFALYPLIYSPGVDGDYGLVPSDGDWAGWPDANLGVTSPNTPCSFQPTGKLVGAPDETNAYRDNITNHTLLAQ
ncbi:MAG: prepilin-type N-terminal cleavage/methylation domain-containing protein [Planctomycetia bacterium]|nr:prepilin-type N-terminal cleavage/methylation domain-containing protein [Planctomycetia bacterium]